MRTSVLIIVAVLTLIFASCRKQVSYPDIPEISYEGFLLRDTTDLLGNHGLVGTLSFSFTDGDGDIGLRQPPDSIDEHDPNYSNLFFTLYDMQSGVLVEIDDLDPPLNYRIPYLEPQGMSKSLTAEVDVDFLYMVFTYDTIMYDFYITDRAGNESNIESTPLFIISNPNKIKK